MCLLEAMCPGKQRFSEDLCRHQMGCLLISQLRKLRLINTNVYTSIQCVQDSILYSQMCSDRQNSSPPKMPMPESLKFVTILGYMAKGNSGCRGK